MRSQVARAASDCDGVKTFFDWGCSGSEDNAILDMLNTVLGWAAYGVIPICVIGILIGAIMYATAGDNQANAKKGTDAIRNAAIALVIWAAARAILLFIIPN